MKKAALERKQIIFSSIFVAVIIALITSVYYALYISNSSDWVFIWITVMIVFVIAAITLIVIDINKRRAAAEQLSAELRSLGSLYISVHRFDLVANTITPIRAETYVNEAVERVRANGCSTPQQILSAVMDMLTKDVSKEVMTEFIDLSTLDKRLAGLENQSLDFLGVHGWARAIIIVSKRDSLGRIKEFLWTIEWIDDEKKENDRLKVLSQTDQMTGIRNRGSGEAKIRKMLEHGDAGMFCLMDVDKFKHINDTYGHAVGDKVIIAIANALQNVFRDTDICMRLGGDEFAVYAKGIQSDALAETILRRFYRAFIKNCPAELEGTDVAVSVGVAFYSGNSTMTFDRLYKIADAATYEAKTKEGFAISYAPNVHNKV